MWQTLNEEGFHILYEKQIRIPFEMMISDYKLGFKQVKE